MKNGSTDQQLVQLLLDRKLTEGAGAGAGKASAAALAVDDMYQALSKWIGTEGCHALFARALAQAQLNHPPLYGVAIRARTTPYVEGVPEIVAEYGDDVTANAIESMLVGMIELLGRLIGVDMAVNLINRSLPESVRPGTDAKPRRKKA